MLTFGKIPIAFKPTYLNMNIPIENMTFRDLLHNGALNIDLIQNLPGNEISWDKISKLKIEYHAKNSWVWTPITSSTKLVNVIYNQLNPTSNSHKHWEGWMIMWLLQVIPKVKFFLWKYFRGKLVTYACFYNINIGPTENCLSCGLVLETAEYVIWSCNRSKICWDLVSAYAGVNLSQVSNFCPGDWLFQKFKYRIGDKGFKALIASSA